MVLFSIFKENEHIFLPNRRSCAEKTVSCIFFTVIVAYFLTQTVFSVFFAEVRVSSYSQLSKETDLDCLSLSVTGKGLAEIVYEDSKMTVAFDSSYDFIPGEQESTLNSANFTFKSENPVLTYTSRYLSDDYTLDEITEELNLGQDRVIAVQILRKEVKNRNFLGLERVSKSISVQITSDYTKPNKGNTEVLVNFAKEKQVFVLERRTLLDLLIEFLVIWTVSKTGLTYLVSSYRLISKLNEWFVSNLSDSCNKTSFQGISTGSNQGKVASINMNNYIRLMKLYRGSSNMTLIKQLLCCSKQRTKASKIVDFRSGLVNNCLVKVLLLNLLELKKRTREDMLVALDEADNFEGYLFNKFENSDLINMIKVLE